MSFSLLYITHPSKPEADRLSIALLNEKLIACVNYFPVESVYHWEWSIARVQEVVTLYKTSNANVEKIREFIEKNHKYEVPCIMKVTEVTANESYEKWVYSQIVT